LRGRRRHSQFKAIGLGTARAGLSVAAGIAILSYEMKNHGNRWCFLPSMAVAAADGVLTLHLAGASR